MANMLLTGRQLRDASDIVRPMRRARQAALVAVVTVLSMLGATASRATAASLADLPTLAMQQTQWYTNHAHAGMSLSPQNCNAEQPGAATGGAFFLPVISTNDFQDTTIRCTISAKKAQNILVDGGGIVAYEDVPATCGPGSWTPDIIDGFGVDVLPEWFGGDLPTATLDGQPLVTTAVASPGFFLHVKPSDPYEQCGDVNANRYDESVALGHRGAVYSKYLGYKALISLAPGRHIVTVTAFGHTVTYDIRVV